MLITSRRKFLSLVGGGVVLAAAGGGLWAGTRDPAAARRPWTLAGGAEPDPRRRVLSFAILAPNPHNRQPWVADLGEPNVVTLYCDPDRRLAETDPYDRQITIGLGCFLELFVEAAAEAGYRTDIALFPDGEPQPRLDGRAVARLELAPDKTVAREPLFANVLERRSNKGAYDLTRRVDDANLRTIASAARAGTVDFTADPVEVAKLRAIAWSAMLAELTNPATAKESVDLTRIGRAEIEANPDGISLAGPLLEGLALTGMLSKEDMLDPGSSTFKQQIPFLKAQFDSAMAFLWLTSPANSRADQIAAGRDYVRLNLAATGLGVAMHPFSQALQEFAAMAEPRAALRNALHLETETLQMFVRLGYAPAVKPAPRWPFETRIKP